MYPYSATFFQGREITIVALSLTERNSWRAFQRELLDARISKDGVLDPRMMVKAAHLETVVGTDPGPERVLVVSFVPKGFEGASKAKIERVHPQWLKEVFRYLQDLNVDLNRLEPHQLLIRSYPSQERQPQYSFKDRITKNTKFTTLCKRKIGDKPVTDLDSLVVRFLRALPESPPPRASKREDNKWHCLEFELKKLDICGKKFVKANQLANHLMSAHKVPRRFVSVEFEQGEVGFLRPVDGRYQSTLEIKLAGEEDDDPFALRWLVENDGYDADDDEDFEIVEGRAQGSGWVPNHWMDGRRHSI